MTDSQNTSNGQSPKGKAGAPKGNSNALRHGLTGGKLPKSCSYIENKVNALRRTIEAIVLEAKGEISITDAASINSMLKWERYGQLANHWLRHEAENLTASERLKFSEATAKASDKRDANIKSLGLDALKDDDEPWLIEPIISGPLDLEDK